jgi:hypothetical protein
MGPVPLRLKATAMVGNVPVTHYAQPEFDGRIVPEGYLTVLDPAPFKVEAVATLTPQRLQQMNAEIGQLAAKINAPDPKFDASLAAWSKKAAGRPTWTVLNPATASSAKGTPLVRQPDGSFMASGNVPAQDVFTVTANTDLKGITAVRLEVMADARLPGHGPGAASNGNFVLSAFKLLAGKAGKPAQPVAIKSASADFSQANFPVINAVQAKPDSGWAVMPEFGKTHTAIFTLAAPIGSEDGATLTFVLEQMTGFANHLIGRFRVSVTTADPSLLGKDAELPRDVAEIVAVPAEERTKDQQADLAAYFRTINPDTAPQRMRLDAMRNYVEPYAQIQRLEAALRTETPQLQKEQQAWEKQVAAGAGWRVLPIETAKSEAGVRLEAQPDGSYFADGPSVPNDTYDLTLNSPLKGITAICLELLPDSRLPNNGPGRSPDGNFILTRFQVLDRPGNGAASQPVAFDSARATFEQDKYELAGVLDDKDDTGWAISPAMGRPVEATFYPKQPIAGGKLSIRLEQRHKLAGFTIGRFRLRATTNKQPDAAVRPPEQIERILRTAARSPEQQAELAAYFRSIAPSLAPVRQRLADLRSEMPSIPIRVPKGKGGAIPVPVDRTAGFAGDVQVSLEGFANGREGNGPAPISKEFTLVPLTVPGDKMFGTLTFQPVKREQLGARMVVLKAEAKVGNETITDYSPAFPLTVEK